MKIFELFLDTKAIDLLVKQTVTYADQSGNHQFKFTLSHIKVKVLIVILLLPGYCSVLRKRLYWSKESATNNEMVSLSMRRHKFEYVADSWQLSIENQLEKVWPLLDNLNNNFLKYGTVFESNIFIDKSMTDTHLSNLNASPESYTF